MRQFQKIVLAYFVIAVVMWSGGAINWEQAGVAQYFFDVNGGVVPSGKLEANLDGIETAIQSVINMAIGGLQIFWNLIVGIVSFIHWPVVVLAGANAPPRITVLVGGGFVVVFYLSLASSVLLSS